jgi:hypothetical protein
MRSNPSARGSAAARSVRLRAAHAAARASACTCACPCSAAALQAPQQPSSSAEMQTSAALRTSGSPASSSSSSKPLLTPHRGARVSERVAASRRRGVASRRSASDNVGQGCRRASRAGGKAPRAWRRRRDAPLAALVCVVRHGARSGAGAERRDLRPALCRPVCERPYCLRWLSAALRARHGGAGGVAGCVRACAVACVRLACCGEAQP